MVAMHAGEIIEERYQLIDRFAEGGMGAVFRARDVVTGQLVAVKALLDQAHEARFVREAKLLAELRHPGIVRYLGHGVARSGEHYLVMEWIEGEELAARLERGPLSIEDAVALAARVAGALGVAHALGVVHRDLKPSNVLLAAGRVDAPMLIDFGVAFNATKSRNTRTGLVVGTPWYMAPEQARGTKDIDARADVYSLGCVLFECLTGHTPYEGDHAVAVLAKILLEEPPRLRSLLGTAPPELDALVARMLSKSAAERPIDGSQAASLLAACATAPATEPREPAFSAALTSEEQRVVHVLLASSEEAAADSIGQTLAPAGAPLELRAFSARHGVAIERLADGSMVGALTGDGASQQRAARAVRAALSLAQLSGGARVVVASGMARMRGRLPVGSAVDAAAVLAETARAAGERGVFVDAVTADLVGSAVRFEQRGDLREAVFGAADPLIERAGIFVGRDAELAALVKLFEHVSTARTLAIALVVAPPGAGKSRLASELVARLGAQRSADDVWSSSCDELSRDSSLSAAAQLALAGLRTSAADSPAVRRQQLELGLPDAALPDAAAAREFIGELIGAEAIAPPSAALRAARAAPAAMADQLSRAFAEVVRAAASGRPLVVLIDDFQWCDRASLRLFEGALRELASCGILLVVLARPEVDEHLVGAFEGLAVERMVLAPLPRRAAERLVREQLGREAPHAVVAKLLDLGGGNPLFLDELVRSVRAGRAPEALSGTVLTAVTVRIGSLGADARRVLRAASVLGSAFDASAVASLLSGGAEVRSVEAALVALTALEFLVGEGTDPLARRWSFRHKVLRDAAYATLTDDDRALGHRLAAEWLRTTGTANHAAVARHAELGGALELAAAAYVRAAALGLESSDFAGARARAADARRVGAHGALLGEVETIVAECGTWLGDFADVAAASDRAMALVEEGSPMWFRAVKHRVAACARLGDRQAVLRITEAIRSATPTAGSLDPKIAALCTATTFLPLQGEARMAREILDAIELQVMAIAERSPHIVAKFVASRAILAIACGDLGAYLSSLRQSATLYELAGDRRNALSQHGNVVHALVELGDYAAAIVEANRVIEQAARLRLPNLVALAQQNLGYATVLSGHIADGQVLLASALATFTEHGHKRMLGGTLIYMALSELLRGDVAEASRYADKALAALVDAPPLRAYALAVSAMASLGTGDAEGGYSRAEEAMALLDSLGGVDSGESEILLAAARAAVASKRFDRADEVLRRARDRLASRSGRLGPEDRPRFLATATHASLLQLADARLAPRPPPPQGSATK